MMEPWVWVWVSAVIVFNGATALAGGLIPETWLLRRRAALIGFAAGTLLAAALLDILPEALEMRGPEALWWCAGGFVTLAVAEWWLHAHVHRRGAPVATPVTPTAMLTSDALHNISDGIAIAAAFMVSPALGIATSLAVLAHELPEEIGDYVLLRGAGVSRRRAMTALAAVQGTAALGAFGTLAAASYTVAFAGIALSIAAGTFLFISATDLLPEVLRRGSDRRERVESLAGFLVGAIIIVIQAAAHTE